MSKAPWIEPDLQALLDRLPDVSVLGLTLYGEARSEPVEGIVGVGQVVQARAADDRKRWPRSVRGVCLQPWQFSCWNPAGGAGNYARVRNVAELLASGTKPEGAAFEECAFVALGLMRGALRDRVKQSNHYHTVKLQPRPAWAQPHVPLVQVGAHVFYRL